MKKIFLITKLKTSNIGNEALSHEIIRLFKDIADDAIINVNGRPFGLDGYLPARLLKVSDPIQEFENWTDKIVNKIKSEPDVKFVANEGKVILYQQKVDYKIDKWKSKLKPIKRFINSLLVYSKEYKSRASVLKAADWLIYSGAGEVTDGYRGDFNDAHVFIRQMIEIRVAQKLGINTAAVNQSIFVNLPLSQQIIAHVYKNMKKIVIRGTSSRDCLISYGVPSNLIEMAPDSAINTLFENAGKVNKNKNIVGLNFSNHVKISDEEMERIVNYLKAQNKTVFYCTNEPVGDYAIIEKLNKKFNIPLLDGHTNYKEYAQKLSEFDFVMRNTFQAFVRKLLHKGPAEILQYMLEYLVFSNVINVAYGKAYLEVTWRTQRVEVQFSYNSLQLFQIAYYCIHSTTTCDRCSLVLPRLV